MFDHHCYYVDNCIGENNIKKFLAFVSLLFLFCIFQIVYHILTLSGAIIYDQNYDLLYVLFNLITGKLFLTQLLSIIYLIFSFLVIVFVFIVLVNTGKSVCLNKTVFERYVERQKAKEVLTQPLNQA